MYHCTMKFVVAFLFLLLAFFHTGYAHDTRCGVVASDNPIHQHPWLVLIRYFYKRMTGMHRCGGTLITARHIITSAHCVQSTPILMLPRLGEYNVSSGHDCVDGVCADPVLHKAIEKVIVHPGYRSDRMENDLAILVLETEAHYTDFIRPICLPSKGLDPTLFYASGFGETPHSQQYSSVKKTISLPLYPYHHCRRVFKILSHVSDVICAGGVEDFDTCNGDSGGPLVRRKGGVFELWGVTKGGIRQCGAAGGPGVYTSVRHHLSWIRKVIEMTPSKKKDDVGNSAYNYHGSYFFCFFGILLVCF